MGLADVQGLLAQIYTDAATRHRFFGDPQMVGQALGLDPEEAGQLASLPVRQVEFFASSLKRKRLNEVRNLLPLTCSVLGEQLATLFWQYADSYRPYGLRKHHKDAFAFSSFIQRFGKAAGIQPAWVVDLALYETAWLGISSGSRRWIVSKFRYPVGELVRTTALEKADGLKPVPTVGVWLRFTPRGAPRHFILSVPSCLCR
jgi:hypothetical protein